MMIKKTVIFLVSLSILLGCSNDEQIWAELNKLGSRVEVLENQVKEINANISSLQNLVKVLQENAYITNVVSNNNGYTITLSNGNSYPLYNGKDGKDAPMIGVRKDTDGVYYWTISTNDATEWLLDVDKKKLHVTGITPQLKISEDSWFVSYGNEEWSIVEGSFGIAKNIFKDIDNTNFDYLVLILFDDTVVTIPKNKPINLIIGGATKQQKFIYGETKSYEVVKINIEDIVVSKPDGWRVSILENELNITAPTKDNVFAEEVGDIQLIGISVTGMNTISTIKVSVDDVGDVSAFKGEGTNISPFLISSASDLKLLADIINGVNPIFVMSEYNSELVCYRQTKDIDLSLICSSSLGNWNPIGNLSNPFNSVFDGGNYSISGIYINGGNSLGLFGHIDKATLKNISLSNGNISGQVQVGSLAGYVENSTIINCNNLSVLVTSKSSESVLGGSISGGIIAELVSSEMYNCYNRAMISGYSELGGLVGMSTHSQITNCYNKGGLINSFATTGGIVGYKNGGSVTNCYSSGEIPKPTLESDYGLTIGGVVGYNGHTASSLITHSFFLKQTSTNLWLSVTGAYNWGSVILSGGFDSYGTLENSIIINGSSYKDLRHVLNAWVSLYQTSEKKFRMWDLYMVYPDFQ